MAVKGKRVQAQKKDYKKERVFRLLADQIASTGITVRREQLRRGQGWRASSGSCILKSSNLILIDSSLHQDDQVELLVGYLRDLKTEFDPQWLEELPASIRGQLCESVQQAA